MSDAPVEDPGFALGEDAPQNRAGRAAQEANWAETNVDARRHYSMREALQVQKPAILNALETTNTDQKTGEPFRRPC